LRVRECVSDACLSGHHLQNTADLSFNTPSVGKSPKNKGPDFPGFAETDRTVAARSSRLHHDIRTLSCILASRVITCEGMHCLAECLGSAVRACGGRGGGHHALLGALCSRSLAGVGLPYPPGRPCMYHVAPQCPPITRLVSRYPSPDHRNRLNCAARHMRPAAAPGSDHERPRALHLAALAAPHSSCSSPRPSPSPRAFVAPAGCSLGSKRPLGSRGLRAACHRSAAVAGLPRPLSRCPLQPVYLGAVAAAASLLASRSVRRLSGLPEGAGAAVCGVGWVWERGGSRWSDLNGRRV
jgi:hypothetical protein